MLDIESIIANVQPTLAHIEPDRLAYKKKSATFISAIAIAVVASLLTGFISDQIIPFAIAAGVVAIISGIVYAFTVGKLGAAYVEKFKSIVIPQVLKLIDPNLGYDAKRGIDRDTFNHSELFTTNPDRYKTEDLVSGKFGDTFLQLAEIDAEERRTRTDSDGKSETYYVTIFDGLLLIADFHKEFHGRTFVFPDNAESSFGKLGRMFQKMAGRSGTKLVQLEDVEFEKAFAIYSNDEIECRYILSTAMMRRLLDMRSRFGQKDIRFAFKDSCVWIAVPRPKTYLEPSTGRPSTDPTQIRRMLEELKSFLDIIEEMSLNTRIWSKQ